MPLPRGRAMFGGGAAAVAVILLATGPIARAATPSDCGAALEGTFVMRLYPWQTQPNSRSYQKQWDNVEFVYSELTVRPASDPLGAAFTQFFVNQFGHKVTCEWQCVSEIQNAYTTWHIQGGKMTEGQQFQSEFMCSTPQTPDQKPYPLPMLYPNCGPNTDFDLKLIPNKHPVYNTQTWNYTVSFENPPDAGPSRLGYMQCDTKSGYFRDGTSFQVRGDAKPKPPTFDNSGWMTGPGTIILIIIFLVFAAGWIGMFVNACSKLEDLPDSDDESESGSSSESD